MARRISNPIRSIYHFLSDKDSMHSEKLMLEETNIREIDRLTDSINEYIEKSQEQTETIIALHEQEIQTQMLALQSQMNPHFLYNSLASIAEMAREGLADSVMVMTSNISEILRYISSNKEQLIPIGTELDICDKYLECMKIRFGENLQYGFEIDDDLWDVMIPKLCIQLLVENAIKSVTKQAPPWKISIIGRIEEDCWKIEVSDNGSGFDAAAMEKLRVQTESILTTHSFPSLQINGSGLLNIFIRFYLIDKAPFIFEYGNRESGGAYVRVGRYIRKVLNDDSMNIIYISHKTSYALELFQNHPYDFLVKPISKTILYTTLTKLLRLDEVQNKKFRYTYNKIGYSVHYGDILYFSSRNKTVFIYKTNGDVLSYYGKLKDIINKLPFQFVCIGKSFIINLKYIKSWKSDSVLLEDGTELGIAQSRRADFKKAIYNYGM